MSADYRTRLADFGFWHSVGRTGQCWDNALPDLLFPPHPAWIRRHNDTREEKYVTSLARALEWGFRDRPRSGR